MGARELILLHLNFWHSPCREPTLALLGRIWVLFRTPLPPNVARDGHSKGMPENGEVGVVIVWIVGIPGHVAKGQL